MLKKVWQKKDKDFKKCKYAVKCIHTFIQTYI